MSKSAPDRHELERELAAAKERIDKLEKRLAEVAEAECARDCDLPSYAPALLGKSRVVFWMRDVESGAFVSMSKSAEACLGFSSDALLQDAGLLEDRILPSRSPAGWELRDFEHPDELREEEIRYAHPDGSVRWLWARTQGGFDATGRLTHTMGILGDCTSQRREMETRIERSDMLQRVLDSITSAVFLMDSESRYMFVNKHFATIFGVDNKQLAGKPLTAIHDHAVAKDFLLTNNEILKTGKPLTVEYSLPVQGVLRHFITTKAPVLDEHGYAMGICGVAMDVTAQKEVEQKLRETSQLLNSIMDFSSAFIFVKDRHGRYVRVNQAFADAIEIKPERFIGKTDFDIFDTDRARHFRSIDSGVVASQEPYTFECTMIVHGEERHLLTTCFPLRDGNGNPDGVCVISTDITDQHIAAEAIAANERRFRAIINSVDRIAIQGYDEDRRVIFWNPPSERLYGYTREEAIGELLEDLIIPDHMREAVIEAHTQWVEKDMPIPAGELVLRNKQGGDVDVYSSHLMYQTIDGRREMFCVDVDLTEIKRMERELIAARDVAESASRAKSEFLANMSHEIRTPLNGIMGMLQLMGTEDLSWEQSRYLDIALTSCRNLTRLLSDILDLSRVEAGKMELVDEEFSVNEIIETLRPTYGDEARRKGIELDIHVEEGFPDTLVGDPIRLRQVLMNLVGNAIKFTEMGSVTVDIRGEREQEPQSFRIVASVQDTGIGISREQLAVIFEPFAQLESAYQRKFQGAGLGLSIVKRLMQLMGGFLTIESEPGVGTTIQFSAPFRIADGDGRKEIPVQAPTKGSMRLLVVEDEPINRMTLCKLLEHEGYTVTEAAGGPQALELLAKDHVDLILMDIQMPGMDGLEVTRRIREGDVPGLDPNIPIIALTAYAMAGDRESFLQADMDDYLSKPVDINDLRNTLKRFTKITKAP